MIQVPPHHHGSAQESTAQHSTAQPSPAPADTSAGYSSVLALALASRQVWASNVVQQARKPAAQLEPVRTRWVFSREGLRSSELLNPLFLAVTVSHSYAPAYATVIAVSRSSGAKKKRKGEGGAPPVSQEWPSQTSFNLQTNSSGASRSCTK